MQQNRQVAQGPVGYITKAICNVVGRFEHIWRGHGHVRLASPSVSVDTFPVGSPTWGDEDVSREFAAASAAAVLDGCNAGLVAAGFYQPNAGGHVFSPVGPFNPGSGASRAEFSGAYGLSRALWHLDPFSMRSSDNSVIVGRNCLMGDGHIHVGSVGAMLAACHPGGHCCLAYTFDGYFSIRVPHPINTLRALQSWVKTAKPSVVRDALRVGVITISAGSLEQSHLCPLPGCYATGQYVKWHSGVAVRMVVCDAKVLLKENPPVPGVVRFDANYEPAGALHCNSCPTLSHGRVLCDACGFVVKSAGHFERCNPHPVTATALGVVYRRAQIGDAVHRLDVLTALMAKQVSESTRTISLNSHISAVAQARYMRRVGYKCESDRVLSTHFEAIYDTLRVAYLRDTFGVAPAFGFPMYNDIDIGVPTALDARRVSGPVDSKYADVWRELDGGSRAAYQYTMPGSSGILV